MSWFPRLMSNKDIWEVALERLRDELEREPTEDEIACKFHEIVTSMIDASEYLMSVQRRRDIEADYYETWREDK